MNIVFQSINKKKVEKSTLRGVKTEFQNQIYRKCDKQFVPLKEQTKPLSNLKKVKT